MSETMIEKVADAIGEAFAEEHERLFDAAMAADGSLTGIADAVMAKCARAAIEAMKEPTEAMTYKGEEKLDFDDNISNAADEFNRGVCKRVFTAMIDAALTPTTPS